MRFLFEIDSKDYIKDGEKAYRESVRGILIKEGKIGVMHSLKYDYYVIPGGGIEKNETKIDALIREFKEETGFLIDKRSISEYGYTHTINKGMYKDIFDFTNYYFLINVFDSNSFNTNFDQYEIDEEFVFEYVYPEIIIDKNSSNMNIHVDKTLLKREIEVIKLLVKEIIIK